MRACGDFRRFREISVYKRDIPWAPSSLISYFGGSVVAVCCVIGQNHNPRVISLREIHHHRSPSTLTHKSAPVNPPPSAQHPPIHHHGDHPGCVHRVRQAHAVRHVRREAQGSLRHPTGRHGRPRNPLGMCCTIYIATWDDCGPSRIPSFVCGTQICLKFSPIFGHFFPWETNRLLTRL